jgi:GH18 family chitinase
MANHATEITDDDNTPLQDLVKRKSDISGLKVLIAVGGWDFSYVVTYIHWLRMLKLILCSEMDATKDLFTLMISTSQNRATFIASVAKFLTQFGLDGIGKSTLPFIPSR